MFVKRCYDLIQYQKNPPFNGYGLTLKASGVTETSKCISVTTIHLQILLRLVAVPKRFVASVRSNIDQLTEIDQKIFDTQ